MKQLLLRLRWVFSNSGSLRGGISPSARYIFAVGRRPLRLRRCAYCGVHYYAFTDSNYYCGSFGCFEKARRRLE